MDLNEWNANGSPESSEPVNAAPANNTEAQTAPVSQPVQPGCSPESVFTAPLNPQNAQNPAAYKAAARRRLPESGDRFRQRSTHAAGAERRCMAEPGGRLRRSRARAEPQCLPGPGTGFQWNSERRACPGDQSEA